MVQNTLEELVKTNSLPVLEITDISPGKSTYTQGEGVAGVFVIKNIKGNSIPDLKYRISLVGGYGADGLAREIYDSRFYGPVFLKALETKEINFAYLLPSNVAGSNLGLRIELYTSTGLPLTSKDKPIEVTGENSMLKISDAYLSIGNTKYSVSAGPTLSATKKATINIKLENPFNQERTLTPEVKIYNQSVMGALLKTVTLKSFTVSAKGTKSFSSEISYLDKPGIYEVAVNFYNSQKVKVAPTTLVKYVVSGPMATIQQVKLDKNTLKAGDEFIFKMVYTGIPVDIDQASISKENILSVSVTILNEEARLVSSYNSKIDFNKGNVLEVPLTAKEAAKKEFVNVVITDTLGNKITAYNHEITGNTISKNNFPGVLWALGLLFLLAIIIISVFYQKNKVLKTFLFIGIFCCSIFSTGTVLAQTGIDNQSLTESTPEQLAEMNNLPSVEISDISIPKNVYKTGETITGTFTLSNDRNYNLPDLKYQISLVGDYNMNGLAGVVYDSKFFGPVFLKATEMKEISFSYSLPSSVAGSGLGIQIQTYTATGILLSWSDIPIRITGETSILKVLEAYLSVGEVKHGLQAGPTLSRNKNGILNVRIQNTFNKEQVIQPEVRIYDRTVSGALIKTLKLETFTVLANGAKDFQWEVSYLDKAGVYEVAIDFFNNTTTVKAVPTILARYIVGGSIAVIQQASVNKETLTAGDAFNVNIIYTGVPADISQGLTAVENLLNLSIIATNEDSKTISKYSGKLDFNKGSVIEIPLIAEVSAKEILLNVKVTDGDGKVITAYVNEMTGNTTPKSNWSILYIFIAIIIMIVAGIFYKRNKIVSKVMIFGAIFATYSLLSLNSASANSVVWTSKSSYNNLGNTVMTISSPNSALLPGEHFRINSSISTIACANSYQVVEINRTPISTATGTTNYLPVFKKSNAVYNGGGEVGWYTNQISLGADNLAGGADFIAPTTPGDYYINLQVNVRWVSNDGGIAATSKGYIKFTVIPSPVVTAVTSANCGGKVNLNWNAITGASNYKVYKNGSTVPLIMVYSPSYTTTATLSDTFKVKAFFPTGETGYSNSVSATPSIACALPVCSVSAGPPEDGYDDGYIDWVAIGGLSTYIYNWTTGGHMAATRVEILPGVYEYAVGLTVKDNSSGVESNISCPTYTIPTCSYPRVLNICSTGTLVDVNDTDSNYLWNCTNTLGEIASCSMSKPLPAAPSLTAVTSASCGGMITLNWNTVPGATSYEIYRNADTTTTLTTTGTSFNTTATAEDEFTVKAISDIGSSVASNVVSARPSGLCPVADLTAVAASTCGGYTTLSWGSVSGVDGYYIYNRGIFSTTTTDTTYTLLATTADVFTVKSYLGTQESELSNSVNGVPSAPCPVTLTAVAATEPGQCGGYTTLSWGSVSDVDGYHVYRGTETTPIVTTTATSTTLLASSTQSFTVKSYLGTQESAASNSVNGVPSDSCPVGVCSDPLILNSCVAPSTFTNMEDTVDTSYWRCNGLYSGASTICSLLHPVLTINKIGSGTGLVTSTSSAPSTPVINCGSDCTSANAPVLPGAEITLTATPTPGHVFAGWNGGGCSEKDVTCTFAMSTTTIVEAKFNIVPPKGLVTETSQCGGYTTLGWESVSGVDGYYVYRGIETTPFITTTATSTTFVATATESYIVKTYLGDQKSDSTSNVIAVPSAVCSATGFTATTSAQCGGFVTLNWKEVPNATGYKIYKGTILAATTSASVLTYTTTALETDEFTIVTTSANGDSPAVGPISATPSVGCSATLSVTKTGTGTGIVSDATGMIRCGPAATDCEATFPVGRPIALTATPTTGHTFAGWSGGTCSGTALTCNFTMSTTTTVNAEFNLGIPNPLTAATSDQCGGYTTLSWGSVSDVDGYHVYNGTNLVTTTTATSTTISASVNDYFTVKTYLGTQESAVSNGVYGAPSDPCNPICGSVADGVRPAGTDRSTPPGTAEEKCQFGIASAINGDASGPWNWTCTEVASSVACTVTPPPTPPDAYCGTFNGTTTAIAPSTIEEKCRVGTSSDITGGIDAPWTWTCSSAGYVSSCSTTLPVAPLSVSCSVSPSTAAIGETVTWTATPTGGVGDYTYNWVGPNLTGKDNTVATTSYSEVGDYYGQVTVTDQGANEDTVSCDNHVTITPDPTVSCSGTGYYDDPLNIPSGKISWLATSYNAGNPNYSWNSGLSTNSDTLLQDIVSGVTRYTAMIKVTDLANNKTATSSCEIQTNGVDGSCGVPEMCTTGTLDNIPDEGAYYKWNCNGNNGGLDTQCLACKNTSTEPVNTYCGSADGTTRTTPPDTDTEKCSAGTAGVVTEANGTWTWSCNNDCYVSSCSASAVVVPQTATLSVNRVGPGIVSDATGMIICGPAATDCAVTLPVGTPITLTATPESGATFQGWSGGGCTGTGVCSVTLNVDTTINGTFTSPPVSPSCGSADGTTRTTPPDTDAEKCSVGTPSIVAEAENDSWNWTCANQGRGTSCSATRSGAFTVSCTVAPDVALTGDIVTWIATSTGGVGAYTYSWAGTNLTSKNTAIATTSYATKGTYYGIATVKRGTETLSVNCTNSVDETPVIIRDHLAASCSVNPTSITTGQTVTWTATSTGGIGNYTYSWLGHNLTDKTTAIAVTSYSGVGTYTATSTIKRGDETSSVACGTGVTIGDGTCSDEIMNGNETGIDLGGRCAGPTCSDNIKNGTETSVDCGGTCPTCVVPCTGDNCGGGDDDDDGGGTVVDNNYCSTTSGQCIDDATVSVVDANGRWTCTKINGDGSIVSNCSADAPTTNLSCVLELINPQNTSKINRNSNSTWRVTAYPDGGSYTYAWYIENSNNTVSSSRPYGNTIAIRNSSLNTLNYILNTTGPNILTAKVTVTGTDRTAFCTRAVSAGGPVVNVVSTGGSVWEN